MLKPAVTVHIVTAMKTVTIQTVAMKTVTMKLKMKLKMMQRKVKPLLNFGLEAIHLPGKMMSKGIIINTDLLKQVEIVHTVIVMTELSRKCFQVLALVKKSSLYKILDSI